MTKLSSLLFVAAVVASQLCSVDADASASGRNVPAQVAVDREGNYAKIVSDGDHEKLPRIARPLSRSSPQHSGKTYKLVQVQIVHRHGDRTPITPLRNETYWASALPNDQVLERLAKNTKLLRDGPEIQHLARGQGPFGKLTQLGLLQMVDLGTRLREELHLEAGEYTDQHHQDERGNLFVNRGRLFDHTIDPLHPKRVKVISTDFPRTIQSVQGVLVGMFPDAPEDHIEIDVRHSDLLIPDPQPRRHKEQEELELDLATRPHLLEKEVEMRGLAFRTTQALRPLLADHAFAVSFGVGEEKEADMVQQQPLSWAQLSEVTKCLQVRNLLPHTISAEDQETIAAHTAWRWFENLRHPRLAHLSMGGMVSMMVETMNNHPEEVPLTIYSAHDSTLIGLLSAFRLEQPALWPEYGSYFKIELFQVSSEVDDNAGRYDYFVRFSLNGQLLRCMWEDEEEPHELIPLDALTSKTSTLIE